VSLHQGGGPGAIDQVAVGLGASEGDGGGAIDGVGSNLLRVHGQASLSGATHICCPDHIEVGSFIGMAAVTGGDVTITGCEPNDLRAPLLVMQAGGDQILHHLLLPVDGDGAPAGELIEGDAVIVALEAERDAAMHEPLTVQPLADSGFAHELHGSLLENTCAHALFDVLAAAQLEDHRVDPRPVEEMREQETRRSRAHDADLRTSHPCPLVR